MHRLRNDSVCEDLSRRMRLGVVLVTACLALPSVSQAQVTSGNFFEQNRPVDAGERSTNDATQGALNLVRDLLHNHLDTLHERINRQLEAVQHMYPSVDFDAVRQWVRNESRDLDRRLFGVQETPSLSVAATQQLVRATNLIGMGANANTIEPTSMDDMLMELLNRVSPVPRELPVEVEYREVRQLVGRLIAHEVEPATIRRQIAERPELARPIARFAVNHPQVLATFPWLSDTLTPYMQEARAAASATNASTSTQLGESPRLVNNESSATVASTNQSALNAPAPRQTIVFNDDTPRNNSAYGYDERARPATVNVEAQRNNVVTGPANSSSEPNQPGMTQEQFRAEMQRQVQRFQQADLATQPTPMNIRVSEVNQTPPIGDVPPAGVRPQRSNQQSAPRNGYDESGNRLDSTRRQYDEQGYRVQSTPSSEQVSRSQPRQNGVYGGDGSFRPIGRYDEQGYSQQPRQNRVYSTDGSSRPIGNSGFARSQQQFQQIYQQSQSQIAQMQANRSQPSVSSSARLVSAENSTLVAPTGQSTANAPAPRQTIVFDDSVPRRTSAGYGYDENARVTTPAQAAPRPTPAATLPQPTATPAITPRQSGAAAPTASLNLGR